MRQQRLVAAALAALFVIGAQHARAADCESLSGKTFGGSLVVETNQVTPPFVITSMGPQRVVATAPFCRVRGLSRPVPESNIYFEVWLPPAERWNGRYQGHAPGGYVGSLAYGVLARAVGSGYAASSTDNGHTGGDPTEWAPGHPVRVVDWSWRAAHATAVASKAIIAAYYGSPARYSYFAGCSKGGGSALMLAQRFPDDYDGILGGAMGWDISGQLAKYVWMRQAAAAPGAWLSPAKVALLHKAVLAACSEDGVMIDEPRACRFDPARLQCRRGVTETCLTPEQVASVRKIYSGPTDAGGRVLSPGNGLGSELGWSQMIMGPEARPGTGAGVVRSSSNLYPMLYGRSIPADVLTIDVPALHAEARDKLGPTWDAPDPDLSAFRAAGGKMISYQGWNDLSVPPASTTRYYDAVTARMGDVSSFYRLFMASGMEHCGGGAGPNAFGGAAGDPGPAADPEHDIQAALERWVEQGRAPERVIATKYRDDEPARGIAAQRPMCAYPATARYVGRGDRNLAASWTCQPFTRR